MTLELIDIAVRDKQSHPRLAGRITGHVRAVLSETLDGNEHQHELSIPVWADVANDAETDAYNVAIAAATGDAKVALQNAKIQNKVLKLEATVLQLTIQAAQGKNTAAKLAAETKKLQNNIALDKKAAGQPATKLTFDATIG